MAHSYWRLYITIPANGDRDESYTGLAELGMYTNGSGTNLCTGGTAFASTAYSGYPAANAFDGSSSTEWAASGNLGQYVGYHFADPVQVDTISILGRGGSETARSPKCGIIQHSDNGTDYTDYSYVFGITYSGQTATIPTPVLAADLVLWKLNITAQSGGGYYTAVATVKMLDSGAVDRYVDYNPSASSTYSGAYAAKYALGDLASTYWSAANDTVPQWLEFYTDNASITSYSIQVRPDAYGCPTEWALSKSTDGGANWTTVDTRTGQTGWTGGETRTFSISDGTGSFTIPSTSVSPNFEVAYLDGVQVGSFSFPATSISPTFAVPVLGVWSIGSFAIPATDATPDFAVMSLTGVQIGFFDIPATSVSPAFAVPNLASGSGMFLMPTTIVSPICRSPSLVGISPGEIPDGDYPVRFITVAWDSIPQDICKVMNWDDVPTGNYKTVQWNQVQPIQ